ncbi:MAG TPA: hypothetical protein VFI54_19000 [Solirubrobacteraceae bacterium]|nr:hypothetical protein [Solirubrobacteraceae bacterium]
MILVRAWVRQALGASGVAVAVPAAMLGVLVLLTLSGGLGRIGNIGQAFSGPRLPAPVGPGPSILGKAGARPERLLAALGSGPVRAGASAPARTPGSGASRGGPAPHRGPSGGAGGQGGPGGPGRGGGTGAPAGGAPAGGGSGGPPTGPGDPSPSHRPSPGPSLVSRVTAAASTVAGRLPGPLGPAAAQTVETVGPAAGTLVPSVPVQAPSQAGGQLPGKVAALASIR